MDHTLSKYVSIYKKQLETGEIQIAYERLIKYVMTVKAHFERVFADKYSCGNVSHGYLDITYFSFSDKYLRSQKLRFGIVLNHRDMRFELWLMGQNAVVQKQYWDLLKSTKWNVNQSSMPKYSVLEVVLIEDPDFDNLEGLTARITDSADVLAEEITGYIKSLV